MEDSEKPIANPVVVLREEFDDWAILFNPDTGDALGINPVGVEIWKLINGDNSLEAITNQIKEWFQCVPESVKLEIAQFIDQLTEKGFIGFEIQDY